MAAAKTFEEANQKLMSMLTGPNVVLEWERTHNSAVEFSKVALMHFTRNGQKATEEPIVIRDHVLHPVKSQRFLGVIIDHQLRFKEHTAQALAKGMSKLWPGTQVDGSTREPSLHTRTAEWVASEMLRVRFTADETCDGVGFDDTHLLTKQLSDVTI